MTTNVTPLEAAEKLALAAQELGESIEETRRQMEKRDRQTDQALANIESDVDTLKRQVQALDGSSAERV